MTQLASPQIQQPQQTMPRNVQASRLTIPKDQTSPDAPNPKKQMIYILFLVLVFTLVFLLAGELPKLISN